MTTLLTLFALAFSLSAAQTDQEPAVYKNAELLIEASDLENYLESNTVVLVDMRPNGYHEGHIPGAVWFGGSAMLVDTTHAVEHHLLDSSDFQQLMRRIGVHDHSEIIIYDEGNSLHAARLFFALELHGHDQIRILNGGIQAWKEGERMLVTASEVPAPGTFTSTLNEERTCDARFLVEAIQRDDIVILDARSPEEFSGEREIAARSGHIPNAVNLEWRNFVESDGIPFFKSAENIAEMLAEKGITPDKEVVTHCHTNVRGSHAYFTLRLMGYDSVRAYEGSWSEWGNLDDVPINN